MPTQDRMQDIEKRLRALERRHIKDHIHDSFDATRIRLKDIDTVYFMQTTVDPSSLADGAGETIQVTEVPGATLGDWVLVSAPYDLEDITVTAYVQAKGVVEIRLQNESTNTVDLASGTWRILIIKKIV